MLKKGVLFALKIIFLNFFFFSYSLLKNND